MIRPNSLPRSICTRCSCQFRAFSTTRHAQAPPPPPSAGYTRLTNRGLISVSGVDSTTFLQGLITQNMFVPNDPERRVRHTGSYAALLNSQGRILNDAFIYPVEPVPGDSGDTPSWLIEVDKEEIPKLLKHLKRHKLRSKLKLRALDDGERTIWATWKDKTHAEPRWAAYNLESPISSPFPSDKAVLGCIDTRAPGFGSRLILPGSEDLRTHFPDESQVEGGEVDMAGYTVRRILHGVAEGQKEINWGSALPLESNMDLARGVDFRKGCYVGQELTIRTHHRGVTRKRIVPVQLYEGDLPSAEGLVYDPSLEIPLPPSETNIVKDSKRKGRSAGKFLSGIGNIGLALCRLETMTDISLTGESAGFDPAQEFKVEWGGGEGESEGDGDVKQIKVKAFVPPWTREFIAAGVAKSNNNNNTNANEGHRARDYLEQLEEEESQR